MTDETESLRGLAHHLAAVTDTQTLLRILLDAVMRECRTAGAGVGQVDGGDGVVVTSAGRGAPVAGVVFPIAGSVAERAIAERAVVVEPRYTDGDYHMTSWAREVGVGEMMVAPLFAAGQLIGILSAWRMVGDESFSAEHRRRLGIIADLAAVALYKARLVEEAQAATLAKSNFLATVSHELRTPLTALAGYGELLADGILGELTPPQHETVERMRAVTHQLGSLIDELLVYSSLEADREQVRVCAKPAAEMMASAAAAIEPLARQKGLTLRISVQPDMPAMFTDPDKVRQILINLGGNAVKFTDAGEVDMSANASNGEVIFAVRDTGIGIAPADRARLFQPFSQLDGGLTRRRGGTGLGLYISRRLATLLGGRIELDSAPGKGSTFTMSLPAVYRAK